MNALLIRRAARRSSRAALATITTLVSGVAHAQTTAPHRGEWYASWGYNAVGFARTDISIVQPSLGSAYTFKGVRAHDQKGWTELFRHQPTVPEYSVRIGYFLARRPTIGVELAFEHARYISTLGQQVRIVGVLGGQRVDSDIVLTKHVLDFHMNNGANFFVVNVVKRAVLRGTPGHTGSVSALGKIGAGVLFPHADNVVFGVHNSPGYQFGGFDAGVELALRAHVFRHAYVEVGEKGVFGRYRGIQVHDGHAGLNVWANVTSVSLGVSR